MIFKFFKKNKYRGRQAEVAPDEIFLDSKNLPAFNRQQFEGSIEHPIEKRTVLFLGIFFVIIGILFTYRLGVLQIAQGETYFEKSQNNVLNREPIFANRGIVYDRNGLELVSNTENTDGEDFPFRKYTESGGFAHILGYVSYPSRDKQGFYWQPEFIGKAGVEKIYNTILSGRNGLKILETDVHGSVLSENMINPLVQGENLTLSIDKRVQEKLFESIHDVARDADYQGATAMVMDVTNGELIALTSYPEYDPNILSDGKNEEEIQNYLTSTDRPFLNRAIGGLYSPGSTVKPFIALGGLAEGVIDPETEIESSGSITIPNPYFPDLPSVFKDYNPDNGWVDMRKALQVSSNIYFYEIAGGFKDQRGIGIDNIGKYARLFGLGERSGIDLPGEVEGTIPSPQWKEKNFPGDPWRLGDTYHTAIGQYGFQVTPINMLRGVAAIASYGRLVTPHVKKYDPSMPVEEEIIDMPHDDFQVIHDGMRQVVELGTARSLNDLSVHVAAKSGTAEVGVANEFINSWIMGFFPYEHPRYAFAVLMERGPSTNTVGALAALKNTLVWMEANTPEYFD